MRRSPFPAALLFFLLAPIAEANVCNLSISVTCPPLRPGQPSNCTSTTVNNGGSVCTGLYIVGFFVEAPTSEARISNFQNGLGFPSTDCFDSTEVAEDEEASWVLCFGPAALAPGGSFTTRATVTPSTTARSSLPVVGLTGVFDPVTFDELAFVFAFNDVELTGCTPSLTVPPVTQSAVEYTVSWSATADPNTTFTLEESTSSDFSSGVTQYTVTGLSRTFLKNVTNSTTFHYRVRPNSCPGGDPAFSRPSSIVVQSPGSPTAKHPSAAVPFGSTQLVEIKMFIPGPAGKDALPNQTTGFTATTDKSYLTVTPSSGTIPPGGTTVTVVANPANLPPGANTGTVTVTSSTGASITSKPVSVSLVTPVATSGKSAPPANSLIIPVVTHVNSVNGPFVSDVRLTNAFNAALNYQVMFTPTQTDATVSGKKTSVTVQPGQTIALNDIAKDFFGFGATGAPNDVGFGSLEIRPLNTSSTLSYASSRTYITRLEGTLGQFIAAVPLARFATRETPLPGSAPPPPSVLSLQQIAQSPKFRTNLGIVEGSGTPVSGRYRVLDANGTLLREVPYSLRPGEHQQIGRFLETIGISNLEDGRIEVTVDSTTGAVTAYASVLDNKTDDPLAVMPVQVSNIRSTRYTLPGMANLERGPGDNFHSDVRIYNGGQTTARVTAVYYPQSNPAGAIAAAPFDVGPGQVKAFDGVLPALFNARGTGGSIVLTTLGESSLVATGRTYTVREDGGTFGQFIPAVMPAEGIGTGDRPLQVLQLEESKTFRSNLGLAELTGNPATVRITITPPDSKASAVLQVDLAPNAFIQLGKVVEQVYGAGTIMYNARVAVEVVGGTGRVTAYGSVIDNESKDPTYVPAQ